MKIVYFELSHSVDVSPVIMSVKSNQFGSWPFRICLKMKQFAHDIFYMTVFIAHYVLDIVGAKMRAQFCACTLMHSNLHTSNHIIWMII